jgi:hypothetical protein
MFKKDQLIELLEKIGNKVTSEVEVYLIGGCNLSLKNLKGATKDIDIVLTSLQEFTILKKAILEIGLKETTDNLVEAVYRDALVVFMGEEGSRIDVFVKIIAQKLQLTKGMISRSEFYINYGKMKIYLVSNNDVFLFKSVTERENDHEDCNNLVLSGLNWKTILEECVLQNKEGAHWIFWLFEQVCRLKKTHNLTIRQRTKILQICKDDLKNKPDDWMIDFSDEEIKKFIPGEFSNEVIKRLIKYRNL